MKSIANANVVIWSSVVGIKILNAVVVEEDKDIEGDLKEDWVNEGCLMGLNNMAIKGWLS